MAAAVACASIALLLGCEFSTPAKAPEGPPNFLLLVVDTLRADRLNFAGHGEGRTPSFDALAAESVWFRNAYSTSSWTLPSTASLFTSQPVSRHRVSSWGSRLAESQTTMVEVLKAAGYRTGMWTANRVVAGRRGFTARFDEAELVIHPDFSPAAALTESAFGLGESVVDRALAWIGGPSDAADAEEKAPFFAYLHFMEPHGPYLCPREAPPECEGRALALNHKIMNFDWVLDADEEALLDELYDSDVSRVDEAIGRLTEGLIEANALHNTWVVLVADHGELLGEEGMYAHGRTLYEAMIHVPLLMRGPSGRGAVVDSPVSLIDLAPTILELAGLAAPPEFMGRSLGEAIAGGELEPRPVVSELLQVGAMADARQRHFAAVRTGNEKIVFGTDGSFTRFDLSADPREEEAVAVPESEFQARLEAAEIDFDYEGYASPEFSEPTPRMRQNLKMLGYLH